MSEFTRSAAVSAFQTMLTIGNITISPSAYSHSIGSLTGGIAVFYGLNAIREAFKEAAQITANDKAPPREEIGNPRQGSKPSGHGL